MIRAFCALALVLVASACGDSVSTTNKLATGEGGVPYTLPRGLVPIVVFVDTKGVGVTIEPSVTAVDASVGTLVARLDPNVLNKEDIQIKLDAETGFLSTVKDTSTSQILTVAEEAAKSAARLTFQNAQADFFKERVVVMQDSFDPLSASDIARINKGMTHAIRHGVRAYAGARGEAAVSGAVRLRVTMPDGSNPFPAAVAASPAGRTTVADCNIGICARTMTTRMIRIEMDGTAFGGKLVNIPAQGLVPVPVTSSMFADQTVSITVQNGVLTGTQLVRESEALSIVKIPGQILGGLVAGFTQSFDDRTKLATEEKELIDAQDKLVKAQNEQLSFQNSADSAARANTYLTETLTVYPFSNALEAAVRHQIELDEARRKKEIEDAAKGAQTGPNKDGVAIGETGDQASDGDAGEDAENVVIGSEGT